eukprot:TRINITY_DN3824_c0_g1_i8.p1 TRINITY_DN3824_c0_g1~~TRINITY_DN3824_c0_g1_i8.p1  ORF type:complete len:597 (-),score=92.76 TRINITY_DN3824_c0_g1_i8:70-1860(-)
MVCIKCMRLLHRLPDSGGIFGPALQRYTWRQLSSTVAVKNQTAVADHLSSTVAVNNKTADEGQPNLSKDLVGRTIWDPKNGIIRISKSGQRWESVIGVEVHAQIKSNSKLFSTAPNEFNQPVNSKVAFFDAAIPGTLPVLNSRCVLAGVRTSLALNANVNLVSFFDRKHYFYADLPSGYQITQQRKPISQNGSFTFDVMKSDIKKEYVKTSHLVQIQIEQDSGKSLHDDIDGQCLVDLNRCGIGLLELVFAPDLRYGPEAAALAKELALVLHTLQACGGRMDRGELRVDANISVRQPGQEFGTRTEVKNLNSLRSVTDAIEFEVWRQIAALEDGQIIENETRSYNVETGETVSMRDKERKQDYRFMPEPNLPPLVLDPALINTEKENLPKLPAEKRSELHQKYGINKDICRTIVDNPHYFTLFMECVEYKPLDFKSVANIMVLIIQEYLLEYEKIFVSEHDIKSSDHSVDEIVTISAKDLVEASNLRMERLINHTALRILIRSKLDGDTRTIIELVDEKDLRLIVDRKYIQEFVDDILKSQSSQVDKYLTAKPKRKARQLVPIRLAANEDPRAENVDMVIFNDILMQKLDSISKKD